MKAYRYSYGDLIHNFLWVRLLIPTCNANHTYADPTELSFSQGQSTELF